MNRSIINVMRRYGACKSGTALIEFAWLVPLLLFLAFIMFEFIAFQLTRIRVDKSSYMIANAISQLDLVAKTSGGVKYTAVSDALVEDLLKRIDDMVPGKADQIKVVASGFSYIDRYYTSAVSPPTNMRAPVVMWARAWPAGATVPNSDSTIDLLGDQTSWNGNVRMRKVTFTDTATQNAMAKYNSVSTGEYFSCRSEPENVVLVEVFYDYRPAFDKLFKSELPINFLNRHTLVSRAFLNPRLGSIEALDGNATFDPPANTYLVSKPRGFCD